jgi:hypothetical protein
VLIFVDIGIMDQSLSSFTLKRHPRLSAHARPVFEKGVNLPPWHDDKWVRSNMKTSEIH